jgi:uncharacterized protein (DUF1810 family)
VAESDPYDLARFVAAQEGTFAAALRELEAGRKRSHWMWFVFPQLRGLGSSAMAQIYAIASLDEARAYLAHPLLGPRLERVTRAVLAGRERSLREIFGSPDDLKFRSSMTLFAQAAGATPSVFAQAIDRCCEGQMDAMTLAVLAAQPR